MTKFYALVPAAGSGARMQSELPKQYLPLAGHPMLYYALTTLCACPKISQVFVVLATDDVHFKRYDWAHCAEKLVPLYCGGATRAQSVANGILASGVEAEDWLLVHDAARPCLAKENLLNIINELENDAVGGILAIPVADTLKRADFQPRIIDTPSRENLWQAQTPQMFRAGLLAHALQQCQHVTDESSAVEALGLQPKLVLGEASNFKVTYPQDQRLAELLLQARGKTL